MSDSLNWGNWKPFVLKWKVLLLSLREGQRCGDSGITSAGTEWVSPTSCFPAMTLTMVFQRLPFGGPAHLLRMLLHTLPCSALILAPGSDFCYCCYGVCCHLRSERDSVEVPYFFFSSHFITETIRHIQNNIICLMYSPNSPTIINSFQSCFICILTKFSNLTWPLSDFEAVLNILWFSSVNISGIYF